MGIPIPTRRPLIVGTNHQTGGLTLRDRLFVEDADVPDFLQALKAGGIDQALVLSTCDRIEIAAMVDDPGAAADAMTACMAAHAGLTPMDVAPSFYRHADEAAVRHLFRVAASLDSVVVGEPQVLGQVKACHRLARDRGMTAGALEQLLQTAYTVAKRVRTETAIGERPVSIAAVAVGLARDVHGALERARGLVLGMGDMGEVIAGELLRAGIGGLAVADAGGRRASMLAQRLEARHVEEAGLAGAMAEADVIVAAVGGRGRPLSADMVRAALRARRNKPQFIVDASLPSDVEPAVDRIDDAFLYDLADLERLAMEGRASREGEARAAEAIVEDEVRAYFKRDRERDAGPTLTMLRDHAQRLRDEALADAGGDAEKATHLLLQRLLHAPSERLREMAAGGEDVTAAERMLRRLFDMEEGKDGKS